VGYLLGFDDLIGLHIDLEFMAFPRLVHNLDLTEAFGFPGTSAKISHMFHIFSFSPGKPMCCPVHRQLLRNALLDLTTIVPATPCL